MIGEINDFDEKLICIRIIWYAKLVVRVEMWNSNFDDSG